MAGPSHSSRIAAAILTSRVSGLLREMGVVLVLGLGPVADSFRAAMRIPNLLQNLLGEGAISASFVPVYAQLLEDGDEDRARRLADQSAGVLLALVAVSVAVVVAAARPLVWLITLGGFGDRTDLAVELTRLVAVGLGFLVLSAWCLGVLNAHRRFFLPYVAPVLWNAAQLATLGTLLVLGLDGTTDALRTATRWVVASVVVGSVAQLAVQLPAVLEVTGGIRPTLARGDDLRVVMRRFAPAVGGRGVVQLSSWVDVALISGLAMAGGLATVAAVTPLYLLAISVFGFSVAVSELTEMARTSQGAEAVAGRVRLGSRKVLLPAGLVTACCLGAGTVVVGTLYQFPAELVGRDALSDSETRVAAATLAAFALGLPAAMTARVTQNACYALGDVRGPAQIAVVRLAVVAVVGFVLVVQLDHLAAVEPGGPPADVVAALGVAVADGPLPDTVTVDEFPHWPPWETLPVRELGGDELAHYGPVGLGLASAAAGWTEWALLRRRLRQRVRGPLRTGLETWVFIAGFATMVAVGAVASLPLPPLVDLIAVGVAGLGCYVGVLWFVGIRPSAS